MARLSRKSRRNQRQNKSQRRNQQNRKSRRNQRQNKRQNRRSRRNQNRRNRRSRRNIRGGNGTGAAVEDPNLASRTGNQAVVLEQRKQALGQLIPQDNPGNFADRITSATTQNQLNAIERDLEALKTSSQSSSEKPRNNQIEGAKVEGSKVEEEEENEEEGNQSSSSLSFEPIEQPNKKHEGQPTRLEVYYTKDGDEICIAKDEDMRDKKCYKKK